MKPGDCTAKAIWLRWWRRSRVLAYACRGPRFDPSEDCFSVFCLDSSLSLYFLPLLTALYLDVGFFFSLSLSLYLFNLLRISLNSLLPFSSFLILSKGVKSYQLEPLYHVPDAAAVVSQLSKLP